MKELNLNEIKEVNGGILPVVAYGVYFGSGAALSFAASFGFAYGAVQAMSEK